MSTTISFMENICDFLATIEEEVPVPGHANLLDDWELDIREYFQHVFQPSQTEQRIFDIVLSGRRDAYLLAAKQKHQAGPQPNYDCSAGRYAWQWLLDATQVEQRTPEWYREKENLLTASEIAAIWAGPLTRARLVKSKVPKDTDEQPFTEGSGTLLSARQAPFTPRLAVPRAEGHAMDWGVRYEPVVKQILEQQLGIKIQDLGRIRHKTIRNLAASPDGLITESKDDTLLGSLVEIKCPSSRQIKQGEIPFEYWCQMQIQMEVCDRPSCEYVEVKFEETDNEPEGYITLELKEGTNEMRYKYHETPLTPTKEEGWLSIETYGWRMKQMLRVTVQRDTNWFASIQNDLQAFWADVEAARAGTWIPPPPRVKKQKEVKEIAFLPDEQ